MKRLITVVMLVVSALWALGASAQMYPNRPIKLIVADSAGGAPDQLGRLITERLSNNVNQPVVVDNRPGAGGALGAELAAKSAPDGYTLLLTTTAIYAILPNLRKNLPYDPVRDFVPITRIATASNVLVVNNELPVKDIAELVKLAKKKPGALNYASAGVGTPAHLAGEMLNLLADIKVVHVPYKGAAPALTDVIAGNAQYIITSPIAARAHMPSPDSCNLPRSATSRAVRIFRPATRRQRSSRRPPGRVRHRSSVRPFACLSFFPSIRAPPVPVRLSSTTTGRSAPSPSRSFGRFSPNPAGWNMMRTRFGIPS